MDKQLIQMLNISNSIITGPPGIGVTSFIISILDYNIKNNNSTVLYYNPGNDICREWISTLYKFVFENVIFYNGDIDNFTDYIIESECNYDILVLDPGDVTLTNINILRSIVDIANLNNCKVICTSQIRQNPNKQGKTYSSVELSNQKIDVFDYCFWIRNVTAPNDIYTLKYVDVYYKQRSGNNYDKRFMVKANKEGKII